MSAPRAQRPFELHFESQEKQEHAARLAMWAFLGSETLLFAGLLTLYGAYRVMYPETFVAALRHNDVLLGTANTVVLITSSFTVAMGVHHIRADRSRLAALFLGMSAGLGLVFLIIKGFEYAAHIHENVLPAGVGTLAKKPPYGVLIGQSLYWFSTALHGLHVVVGIVMLAAVAIGSALRRFHASHYVVVENVGLYWHLVDIVWIFLWPLFYLTD